MQLNFTTYKYIRIPPTHSYITVERCKMRLRPQPKQLFPQGLLQVKREKPKSSHWEPTLTKVGMIWELER